MPNTLFETAIAAARRLPEEEREAIGALVLEELQDERRWQQKFAQDADKLAEIARRVRGEVERGEAVPYDPSSIPEQ